jgi:hypothetical protein
MEKFTEIKLNLSKDVKKGDSESLLSLFSFEDRLKRMEVLTEMEEGESVNVVLEGLGETNLKLGNDMELGEKKTIMTLFWLPEKSQSIEMQRDGAKGEEVVINMWK